MYSSQEFGVECSKWRNVKDYVEAPQVPKDWECCITTIGSPKMRMRSPRAFPNEVDSEIKLCYECKRSRLRGPLIQCDYCPLLFHADCLEVPSHSPNTSKWMCPNHVEPKLYYDHHCLLIGFPDVGEGKIEALKTAQRLYEFTTYLDSINKVASFQLNYHVQMSLFENPPLLPSDIYVDRSYVQFYKPLDPRMKQFMVTKKVESLLHLLDETNPEVSSTIDKQEWSSSEFKSILDAAPEDTYSLIAFGNILLQTLHQNEDKGVEKQLQDLALSVYQKVLSIEPRNIWAANGIGAVLAHKCCISEASDCFTQVREADEDFCDVWLNTAHIYVEQEKYAEAIQMGVKTCQKRTLEEIVANNVQIKTDIIDWAAEEITNPSCTQTVHQE